MGWNGLINDIVSKDFKDLINNIRHQATGDRFAYGIWTTNSYKMAIYLWKLKCGRLYTFVRLLKWGEGVARCYAPFVNQRMNQCHTYFSNVDIARTY